MLLVVARPARVFPVAVARRRPGDLPCTIVITITICMTIIDIMIAMFTITIIINDNSSSIISSISISSSSSSSIGRRLPGELAALLESGRDVGPQQPVQAPGTDIHVYIYIYIYIDR